MTQRVPATLERGVLEIHLNRTEKNNTLTPAMYSALADAIPDGDRAARVRRCYPDIVGAIGDNQPDFASEPLQRDVRRRIIARRHPLVDAWSRLRTPSHGATSFPGPICEPCHEAAGRQTAASGQKAWAGLEAATFNS